MKEICVFNQKVTSAIRKKAEKNPLSKSEKIAIEGKWYFTTVLPINIIDEIIDQANDLCIKPSEFVSKLILDNISEEQK